MADEFLLKEHTEAPVRRRFEEFGIKYEGLSYGNPNAFIQFGAALKADQPRCVELIKLILSDIFFALFKEGQQILLAQTAVVGERGVLRRKLELSAEWLEVVKRGKRLEDILQRLIIELMNESDSAGSWHNQLNVAGGFFSRSAQYADILRVPREPKKCWQFVELKSFQGDHPLAAAIQVYSYTAIVILLAAMEFDVKVHWPKLELIQLGLAAPESWYREYANYCPGGGAEATCQCFHHAVAELHANWKDCGLRLDFMETPIRIDLEKEQLVEAFLPAATRKYAKVGDALTQEAKVDLTARFKNAFTPWPLKT